MDLPEFGRGEIVQGIVGNRLVVVTQPVLSAFADFRKRAEGVHVEDTPWVAAVESFDEAVLHRFAGLDEAELNAVLLNPISQGDRDQLRAVVQAPASCEYAARSTRSSG